MLLLINFHQMGTNTVIPYPSISYDSNHESFIKHVDLFWTSQQLMEIYLKWNNTPVRIFIWNMAH